MIDLGLLPSEDDACLIVSVILGFKKDEMMIKSDILAGQMISK